MILFSFLIGYSEYLIIRFILIRLNKIRLDIFPNYYYDDIKRTWANAGILMLCFVVTTIILIMLLGVEAFE